MYTLSYINQTMSFKIKAKSWHTKRITCILVILKFYINGNSMFQGKFHIKKIYCGLIVNPPVRL